MKEEIKTDYCIVGAGIAGIILASKLASSGKKILILDQGPRYSEKQRANMMLKSKETLNDFVDYNDEEDFDTITPHTSAAANDQVIEYKNNRLFGFGGTALHFQGIMMRPIENDLKVKSLFGYGRDWPITYNELEPWLLKAEIEVGVVGMEDNPYASKRSGPFPMPAHSFSYFDKEIFYPALEKLGIVGHSCPYSINSQQYRGRSACLACRACRFCPSGARYSPDRVHLPLLEKNENVRIIENLSVRKLETDSNGKKIVAAHAIRTKDKSAVLIRSEIFIVAMGGVETPRLLLLSSDNGIHRNGLGNMGNQLGKGFTDHSNFAVLYDAGRHVGGRLGFETMVTDHFRINLNRKEQSTFILSASPAADWYPVGATATQWEAYSNTLSLTNLRKRIPQLVSLWVMMELEGKGILELDEKEVDAFGSPVVKITMRMTDRDMRVHTKAAELISKIGDAMDAINASDITPSGFGRSGDHPSGASAMGKNPDEGVCDVNLKVFGLANLYLVSNSVFPHMGSNPPTLTIVALAMRLAAHLKGEK
ncbi:GMC oxidoreductase [Flagellimonas meridianipacifica]|uniref:Choline dehydrogenase-like flavoprotein n=1 Tax=Flagellimonas meridianipacifica TaxID=1080225 RepID=A0A2T0MIU2_9FLAO|nr:GMC family oxidoreductase [Allomuricauda pacifica]PRX57508.1 choline dehydrogenase-like flavoprotein [Allomuricauda pacifica]